MNNQTNIWKYYEVYRIHTTKKRFMNKMCNHFEGKIITEYFKHGKIIAWDIQVSVEQIKEIRKLYKKEG